MSHKRWLGIAAVGCIACCAVPFIPAVALGLGGLAAIGADAWLCGIALVVIAMVSLVMIRKRRVVNACATNDATSCAIGCACRTTQNGDHP